MDFQRGEKRKLKGIGMLSIENWRILQSLQVDPGERFPAAASLEDGRTELCVMFIEMDSKERQHQFPRRGFLGDFYTFHNDFMIDVDSVVSVFQSPFRAPPALFGTIKRTASGHMFGRAIRFTLKDGTEFLQTSGDFLEFCSVPKGYTTDDIVSCRDAESWDSVKYLDERGMHLESPKFRWCIFRKPH